MLKKIPISSTIKEVEMLADLCGIADFYRDSQGKSQTIAIGPRKKALESMGYDLKSLQTIEEAKKLHFKRSWKLGLMPMNVIHRGVRLQVLYHLKLSELLEIRRKKQVNCYGKVILETGDQISFQIDTNRLEIVDKQAVNGSQICRLRIPLPQYIPIGYHILEVSIIGQNRCSLVVAPETCYEPKELVLSQKIWGVSIQLYSVRSKRNWGIGDYSDLMFLVEQLAENGAHWVAINPLHQLYPANPEHCFPYSSSSRLFANVLYIDPMNISEFKECLCAQDMIADSDFQLQLSEVRALNEVDYQKVSELKHLVLEKIFQYFIDQHLHKNTKRAARFLEYCEKYGKALEETAIYDSLYEYFFKKDAKCTSWLSWPTVYQNPDNIEVKHFVNLNRLRITYFKYLQWLSYEQLLEVQVRASQIGMVVGLCRDLAVGTDLGGAEVWTNQDIFCLDVSVGAPPDDLAPQGQHWGLPPVNPILLKKEGYKFIIEIVRHNMEHCGALRIDHIMGLFRQWWCFNGEGDAVENGTYVFYPMDELLGIIKLESHRNKCLVLGEDLGMVPVEVTDAMLKAHAYSTQLAVFMQKCTGDELLKSYKDKSMAALVNHDTPTLSGWWSGKDIDIMYDLGIFTQEQAEDLKDVRQQGREKFIHLLEELGELPSDTGKQVPEQLTRQIMEHLSYYLMFTASRIVSIQLDDCMLMEMPVNVPGTSVEYPNWRRRLLENLEDFFAKEENRKFFYNLTQCRLASRG